MSDDHLLLKDRLRTMLQLFGLRGTSLEVNYMMGIIDPFLQEYEAELGILRMHSDHYKNDMLDLHKVLRRHIDPKVGESPAESVERLLNHIMQENDNEEREDKS